MHAIRRRLAGDDGISMVEMLIAIFVITVALFALLSGLAVSAQSIGDQRFRAVGTRVAVDHLEALRVEGYEALKARFDDGEFDDPVESTTTADGRDYDIVTTVAELEADPTADPLVYDGPMILEFTATVSWNVRGEPRTVTYSTALGPRNVPDELGEFDVPLILAVTMIPTEAMIGEDGHPTEDLDVIVVLAGFDPDVPPIVQIAWDDQDGNPQPAVTLTSTDGVTTYTGTITRTAVSWTFGEDDDGIPLTSGSVDFTVTAGDLNRGHTLSVRPEVDDPPSFDSITISPIFVDADNLANVDDVEFTVVVSGIEEDPDSEESGGSVRVKYQLSDGTFQEQGLSLGEDGVWRLVVQQGTVDFKVDPQALFIFTATDGAQGGTASETVEHPVLVQEAT